MTTTQIVFMGHSKTRLMISLRQYPVSKIILVVGQRETTGEKKVRTLAKQMLDKLSAVLTVELVKVDRIDIQKATKQIIEIINREKEQERQIILNVSSLLRGFTIAAYIAACLTQSHIVTAIPKYDQDGEEIYLEKTLEVPVLPFEPPTPEQVQLLITIGDGVASVDELIFRAHPNIEKGSTEFITARSAISQLLRTLEKNGFIEKVKVGKTLRINPSWIGKIYTQLPYISFRVP